MNIFLIIISTPSYKEKLKMYSCGELVWNDPIGLLDITNVKHEICATCGLYVIPVRLIIYFVLLKMALLSEEHLQTDGFESLWYSNFVYLTIAFNTGL